jgi:phosphoglycerate dehydrogenase-like enzyme
MNDSIEVLITLSIPEKDLARLNGVSPRLHVTTRKAAQASEIPAEVWGQVEVLFTGSLLPDPEQAPRLRWVQFISAGVDHMIDHPLLHKPGLIATTLSGAAIPQMAEFVMAMMLALGHNLPALMEHQRRSEWAREQRRFTQPQELNSSTVGIVGYGSIGREVARLLGSFGATVLACKHDAMQLSDPGYLEDGLGDPGGDLVRRLYPPQAIQSMLKESDFVVVAVPLTPETRDLIGAAELGVMKSSAYLVDISRGGVVNQAALIAALREGRIAGAALDVFEEEPLPAENLLWQLPNVIITPHIAGTSSHYESRAVTMFSENLQRYLAHQPLYNVIDLHKGY